MVIASGLGAQLGIGEESTYNTPVTVTRFLEFNSEGLDVDVGIIESRGLGTGRFLRTDREKRFIRRAGGQVEFDVQTKGFGMLFKHCLGSYANTLVAGSERSALITPDADALKGLSLTVQVGKPDVSGVARPFTYAGGKVVDWQLKCALDEALKLALTLDFATVTTAAALAAASYPAGSEVFVFSEGALTVGGVTTFVKSASIKGMNGLATERRGLGNVKREPLANGEATIEGELECEFEDLSAYADWVAGTQAQLVLTFTSPTIISGGGPFKLTVTLPAIAYRGSTPKVGGPDIVMQPRPFKALYNGSNPVITIEQRTTDTAA
jgi:hypothetical protein